MSRCSWLVVGALVTNAFNASCGGPPAPIAASLPPETRTQSFGAFSLAAGAAAQRALLGQEVPAHFLCGGSDLSATSAADRTKFRELGPTPSVVMAGFRVSLSSKARASGVPAEEPRDVPGASPLVFVHGRTFTGPDEKTSWVELAGYLATMEGPHENRRAVSALAPPIAAGLDAVLVALGQPACEVPVLSGATLDALPYAVSADEKQTILSEMATVTRGLPRVCRAVQFSASSWEAHFHHADLVFRGNGRLARVRARASIVQDRLCLGPAEIMKIAASE